MRIKQFGPGDGWHHPEAGKTTKLDDFNRNCAEIKRTLQVIVVFGFLQWPAMLCALIIIMLAIGGAV